MRNKGWVSEHIFQRMIFESFVVGEENREAYEATLEIAQNPLVNVAPIFISGNVGLGKTHLAAAMINYCKYNAPLAKIAYVDAYLIRISDNGIYYGMSTYKAFLQNLSELDMLIIESPRFLEAGSATCVTLAADAGALRLVFVDTESLDNYRETPGSWLCELYTVRQVSLEPLGETTARKLLRQCSEAMDLRFSFDCETYLLRRTRHHPRVIEAAMAILQYGMGDASGTQSCPPAHKELDIHVMMNLLQVLP